MAESPEKLLQDLEERLKKAEEQFNKPGFLQNRGLSNEVGYYVFDYEPQLELFVRKWISKTQSKYESLAYGFKILVFDLYDIIIDTLQEKGFLEKAIQLERKGFDKVVKAVESTMQFNSKYSLIIRHIKERITKDEIVLITGIGKAFPLLRSHAVLNNLHQVIDSVPVILFYPGKYSTQDLTIFGASIDGNYYRAFKLVD